MTKFLLVISSLIIVFSVQAQSPQYNPDGSVYRQCLYVKKTKPLTELIAERDIKRKNNPLAQPHPSADAEAHEKLFQMSHPPGSRNTHNDVIPDGSLQTENGTKNASVTIVNIDGQTDLQSAYPLDPNGMVGSNYYVQTINSNYRIYNKTGVPRTGTTDLYDLFGSIGAGDCGDPVTMYDKIADRWIITEFEGCSSGSGDIDTLLMAVSVTNDPTGSYYLYAFDPATRNQDDDYPKYAVWADGYYMTCNCLRTDYVIVYNRAQMLTGGTAGYVAIPWNDSPYNYVCNACAGPDFFCPMMLDCDGTLPPYGSPEFLFYFWDNNWASGGNDEICIDKITVNWNTRTGTTSHYDTIPTSAFNSTFTGNYAADIPQPGNNTGDYLDGLDGFFAYRIPYLRWSSYNTAVMCNVVNIGTTSAPVGAIRWYELHQDTTTKVWSIYQQSTYGPNDGISRWNPGIAMDQNGSIGLEYCVSDPVSVYPGLRYIGRRSCDPLNTMTVSEVTTINGNAIISTPENGGNRWGDYSHLSVDPIDGITFWATNMYAKNGASYGTNMATRIYSFRISSCDSSLSVPNVANPYDASLTAYQNGGTLMVKGTDFPENENVAVQLFDINGKMLMQKELETNTKILETTFNISSLAKAIYIVRIGNDHIQRVIKTPIN